MFPEVSSASKAYRLLHSVVLGGNGRVRVYARGPMEVRHGFHGKREGVRVGKVRRGVALRYSLQFLPQNLPPCRSFRDLTYPIKLALMA